MTKLRAYLDSAAKNRRNQYQFLKRFCEHKFFRPVLSSKIQDEEEEEEEEGEEEEKTRNE